MRYEISILIIIFKEIDDPNMIIHDLCQIILLDKVGLDIKKFSKYPNIKIINGENSYNDIKLYSEGLRNAQGEYIIFSHQDVVFKKNALKALLAKAKCTNKKIITASVEFSHAQGHHKSQFLFFNGEHCSKIFFYNFICEYATLIHRSVFEKVGGLDENASKLSLALHDFWQKALRYFDLDGIYQILVMVEVQDTRNYGLLTPAEKRYLCSNREHPFVSVSNDTSTTDANEGYILVIAEAMTASLELLLGGFSPQVKGKINYRLPTMVDDKILVEASCVLFIRSWFNIKERQLLNRCYAMKIPVYYYFDDNFWEIPEYYKHNNSIFSSIEKAHEFFKDFAGLVTSTRPLFDYACNFYSSEKIKITYPIICNSVNEMEKDFFQGYTFAFIGGIHRLPILKDIVFPVLNRLADKFSIRVIFAGFTSDILDNLSPNINRIFVEQMYFYTAFMEKLQQYKIDFLIHPSTPHPNLKNKTLNSILNAYVLDAVVILTDLPPYSSIKNENIAVLVNNKSEEWYEAIYSLIQDKNQFEAIKLNNRNYCLVEFSPRKNENVILTIIKESRLLRTQSIPCYTELYKGFPLTSCSAVLYKIRIWKLLKNIAKSNNYIYTLANFLLRKNLVRKIVNWLAWSR